MRPTQASTSLKILVFSAKGSGTGCALRAFYIAEAFRKRGHQVKFVKPIPSLPFWFDMVLSKPYYFFISLFARSQATIAVKPYPTLVPALWVQRLKGAKIVFDVDDLDYAYSHGWFQKLHLWLQKPWPNWADLVTYHNPKLKEPIQEVFSVPPAKMVSMPQGVDLDIFNPKADLTQLPPAAVSLLQDKQGGPILTFTAHLNVACDLEPLLNAFQMVLKSVPKAQLLIAGGGPDEKRFKRIASGLGIASSTHFTGLLTPHQVAACLRISELSLVYYGESPANEHRASMKLRESLACGRKVVATDMGDKSEWKNAVFLSQPSPEAFSKVVLTALRRGKSPKEGEKLVKKWDWKNCVAKLEKELLLP